MARRFVTLVAIFSTVAFTVFFLQVEGQETPTPAASPAAGTATAQQASPVASPGATPVAGEVDVVAAERGKSAAAVCLACHSADGSQLVGPTWKGLYGHEVELEDGSKVVADEAYIRESIVDPMTKIVKGYPPSMPPFGAMLTEDQMKDIIEYIKSLT
ncbi:MAG: cytochrome c [Thermomicrobiales bacterium]|nr:cytochrome c [Thermomicrobiales bacterium]